MDETTEAMAFGVSTLGTILGLVIMLYGVSLNSGTAINGPIVVGGVVVVAGIALHTIGIGLADESGA